VRQTKGIQEWRTERAAAKDASFQAYKILYEAGLLNDHLLPLSHSWAEDEPPDQEDMAATVDIRPQLNPWKELAEMWSHCDIHQTHIVVRSEDSDEHEDLSMVLTTPSAIPTMLPMTLHWDKETRFRLHFDPPRKVCLSGSGAIQTFRNITHILTQSTHSDQGTNSGVDFVALFSPDLEGNQLLAWYDGNKGRASALDYYIGKIKPRGFVRPSTLGGAPHCFYGWHSLDVEPQNQVEVQCIPLTKRRNFLSSEKLAHKISPFYSQDPGPSTLKSFPI
jgi:hypothetical protein